MSADLGLSLFRNQPKAVWATAFACVVGFMSIGLVDPILTSIAAGLNASPSQVSLLFTSYFFVTSAMMLVTGFVSSRLGGRKTLLLGAALIVVFAALAGTSNSVAALVSYRAGWGLGNAFFVVTALSVIVATSRGGTAAAILLYEAALGLGISAGPLLGAALGDLSWRYPFFGTAALMAVCFVAIAVFLPEQPKPKQTISLSAPIRALAHAGLATTAVGAMLYYYAFFTVLAFAPFVLQMSAHAVGLIFFGWGVLLAIFSVMVAPRLQARFSALALLGGCLVLFALLLAGMSVAPPLAVAAGVVVSGALMGVCNTVFTEMALEVSPVARPVASAAYNCVRWFAGVVAPFAAPTLAEHFGAGSAFAVAAAAAVGAPLFLLVRRRTLGRYAAAPDRIAAPAEAVSPAASFVLAAVDGTAADVDVVAHAAALARSHGLAVAVEHVRMEEVLDGDAVDAETEAEAAGVVERALARLRLAGISARGEVVRAGAAHAADALLACARALPATIVVLGAPHRHDLTDLVHGSVADTLRRRAGADIAVVTVPEADDAFGRETAGHEARPLADPQ
ncbi:MAG: MFS transporter [Rhodoplanes sp.]|uniref:MFS transporter n=1 Tax=Rhodoplanes sp. TaxID=1968906 RepID=UPI0017F9B698|nr:MFS transporter [Rhodoplanes sp.]NVO15966.1 MFS transporter [Rhodoplanes sp.]